MRRDTGPLWNSYKQQIKLDSVEMAKMWLVVAIRCGMVHESNPRPTDFTCKQGGVFGSSDRERRAPFGSVTRSHYASEHFLTRYPALIICLASAPETYGFIAKYARATKRSPWGKNLISTSCSVLREPPSFAGPMAAFEIHAAAVRLRPRRISTVV